MNIWRVNIKTDGIDPQRFCFSNEFVGIGWRIDNIIDNTDWDTYEKEARLKYNDATNWRKAINVIKHRMRLNDLCWSRNANNEYYLGRIIGDWEYLLTEESRVADVINIRRCKWLKVGAEDNFPGKIVNCFRAPGTIQIIDNKTALEYSKKYYNDNSNDYRFDLEKSYNDIFDLLSAEDCEDVVGIYLQQQGYLIIPSSCKKNTMKSEFTLLNKESGQKAIIQVKSGKVPLNRDDYAYFSGEVFLFAASQNYKGNEHKNIHCISKKVMEEFMRNNNLLLPGRIRNWLKWSN